MVAQEVRAHHVHLEVACCGDAELRAVCILVGGCVGLLGWIGGQRTLERIGAASMLLLGYGRHSKRCAWLLVHASWSSSSEYRRGSELTILRFQRHQAACLGQGVAFRPTLLCGLILAAIP